MKTRTLYLYDEITKEYIDAVQQSESPEEEGVFFHIANSTDMEPPKRTLNRVAVFVDGYWVSTPDYRGQVWYDENDTPIIITERGTQRPGLTPDPHPRLVLANCKTSKKQSFSASCGNQITNGFTSSALGSSHHYSSAATDQMNINTVAVSGGSLWCRDADGNWSFTLHTKAQAVQVQKDMVGLIQRTQVKYADLLVKITEATSMVELENLNWE